MLVNFLTSDKQKHTAFPELYSGTFWGCLPQSRWGSPEWVWIVTQSLWLLFCVAGLDSTGHSFMTLCLQHSFLPSSAQLHNPSGAVQEPSIILSASTHTQTYYVACCSIATRSNKKLEVSGHPHRANTDPRTLLDTENIILALWNGDVTLTKFY